MGIGEAKAEFDENGFVILPGLLADDVAEAVADLGSVFPTTTEFHDDVDPRRNERFRDEFGGITPFPTRSTPLNLVSVHPVLIDLAEDLLGDDDLRCYSIEAWAKYTSAADYEQPFHRDYLNHTLLVPSADAAPTQVEMFVYLSDVSDGLGPIALLPREHAVCAPALPNWYPAEDGHHDPDQPTWTSEVGRPDWYRNEVRATGPAGTVIAYRIDTFHRGTNLTERGGSRFTVHTNFRTASADWITRRAWTDTANRGNGWADFVASASPRQLRLFGFPPPRHPYWTNDTLDGMALRYPGFDTGPWR